MKHGHLFKKVGAKLYANLIPSHLWWECKNDNIYIRTHTCIKQRYPCRRSSVIHARSHAWKVKREIERMAAEISWRGEFLVRGKGKEASKARLFITRQDHRTMWAPPIRTYLVVWPCGSLYAYTGTSRNSATEYRILLPAICIRKRFSASWPYSYLFFNFAPVYYHVDFTRIIF